MGNIMEELVSEAEAVAYAEGCIYHGHRFMSEDGICVKCEDIANDI